MSGEKHTRHLLSSLVSRLSTITPTYLFTHAPPLLMLTQTYNKTRICYTHNNGLSSTSVNWPGQPFAAVRFLHLDNWHLCTGDLLFDQSLFFLIVTERLLKRSFLSKQMQGWTWHLWIKRGALSIELNQATNWLGSLLEVTWIAAEAHKETGYFQVVFIFIFCRKGTTRSTF